MAKAYIYPTSITPKIKERCKKDTWVSNKGGCKDIQPFTTEVSYNNLCKNNDNVSSWGEVHPDAVDHNNPISANFYNTITTYVGSYDTPTSFKTNGWQDIDDIPSSAKIKSIKIQYVWDQVKYTRSNNHITWQKKGNIGHYQSAGGYFKTGPTISLKIGGKTLSTTGPNVRPAGSCTTKNSYSYKDSELKSCTATLTGVTSFTMGDFKKSQLTFQPSKNYASDVTRIVMRYLRVLVEYEDIPSAFNIDTLSITPETTNNCTDNKTRLTVKLKNTSVTKGKTQVKISGSGIANAIVSNISTTNTDTLIKKDNYYLWTINTNCATRSVSADLTYTQAGNYSITAKVMKNAGSTPSKPLNIVVNSCKPVFSFDFLDENQESNKIFKYASKNNSVGYFRLSLTKNEIFEHNESLQIDTDGLNFVDNWIIIADNQEINNIITTQEDNVYTFSNINEYNNITITRKVIFDESGLYNIVGRYINTSISDWNATQSYNITVTGTLLPRDYFKLRLEDGSDVKYNSLMFTLGDDLSEPLTYTLENINQYISQMKIFGESKRIPVHEAQYIHFTIKIDTEEEVAFNNVLTYIDIYEKDNNTDNIIIGASKNVKFLPSEDEYICSIDKISSTETTTIALAVQSDIELDDVVIKIKPYNHDGYNNEDGWIPAHAMFKDIPNIKMSIEGVSDVSYCENNPDGKDIFWLYYKIQNLSNIDAKDVRFQLKEPHQFKKLCYRFEEDNDCDDEQSATTSGAWFNKNNRIITFPELNKNSSERVLAIKYQATKKGIYDFKIQTLNDPNTLVDEQYQNSYTHEVMVNVPSDVRVTTNISKKLPYMDELIDFNINIKNLRKKQKKFKFDIYDIGGYDTSHKTNDYYIEYVQCKNGTFEPMHGSNYTYPTSHHENKIGTWTLTDIDINDEYNLTLSLRPKDIGDHIIKTVFTNELVNNTCPGENTNVQSDFYNEVKIIKNNKKIDFNVYHAISENDDDCRDCSKLIEICDDDFINLGDNIYYVFEIKNNSKEAIQNAIHVYARLPESFLTNGILCSSRNYFINQANNLISFTIPNLPGCQHEDSSIKFCIKIQPSAEGQFTSNFSLSTRDSNVLYKQLKLTVDSEFNNRQLEHEVKIYNFSKTNRYYRYEIDGVGEIFKFYNTGDKTLRPIDIEPYAQKAIEVYKGTNLKKLLKQIKKESKYVDPLFLKTGSNKLADKGYELFPDGLIRRFGLLNSEVYHYSGQFPKISDLVDRAMRWDIDSWDTKVWAGDIYDNGVFELSIDYSKVPSNFDILNKDINTVKNLQSLVDNVKPYGTKAICHYSATVDANIQINIDTIINNIKHDIDIHISLPDTFAVMSSYNRFDNTTKVHYDLMSSALKIEIERLTNYIASHEGQESISSQINEISTHIFADKITKHTAQECYQLIANTYNTINKNIDITKPLNTEYDNELNESLSSIQVLNFKQLQDKESTGFIITPFKDVSVYNYRSINDSQSIQDNIIYCIYQKDDINDFNGFRLILNNNIIEERNINQSIDNISIQVQTCKEEDNNILHFWGSVNNEEYYHIGLLALIDFNNPIIKVYNTTNEAEHKSISKDKDKAITFKISDKENRIYKQFDNIQAIERSNKWQYLNHINKDNKYAYFENKTNIDKECPHNQNEYTVNIPKIALKYNNINIDDLDEIVDIKFKIEAQSNKEDFEKGININLFKDGDKYIPENDMAHEIVYPSSVTNTTQEYLATMDLEQESITICSNCLKTSLGYHTTCPYCESEYVRHSAEPVPATICYNCGWIINGWNDYCTHCLSYDVEKINIDYNKTYCNKCGYLTHDYYEHCPNCFSSDVAHLTNNTIRYKIFGEDKQNIEPIHINIDPSVIDETNKVIDIFSLYTPLNHHTTELQQLEYLTLQVHGHNNNDGKYYYCPSCNSGGVGNYDKCPYCGSTLIHNESISNIVLHVFNGESIENFSIPYGSFTKKIDLKAYAYNNKRDKIKLTFSIENQSYDDIIKQVLKLPIKDEYMGEILDSILIFDIDIDNLSLDYKYKHQHEWADLTQIEGPNHTGIKYVIPNNTTNTNTLKFNDFNIQGEYKHALLNINGFVKNIENSIDMNIKIINNGQIYNRTINLHDMLFNYNYDIIEDIGEYISDLSIEINFNNGNEGGEIIITNCDINLEYPQYKNQIHDDVNKVSANCIKDNNYYLLTSADNNLWGLNDNKPYYLSGRQLDTNLIAYIDFGTLDLQEYIRLYNIDMIISYKTKTGYIVTETLSDIESNKTYKTLLRSAGYSDTEIDNYINTDVELIDALNQKNYNINSTEKEQFISGDIVNKNGIFCGSINYAEDALNNLESKFSDINDNDELIGAIPLYYKIAQSFNTGTVLSSISTLSLNYFGKIGYPNAIINVYICEDYNGKPGNIISNNKVTTDNISSNIDVDVNITSLKLNTTYWIVIEDVSADKNNYHRFSYNENRKDKLNNLAIEQLITYENKQYVYQNVSLSFGLSTIKRDKVFYNLPTTWLFDTESFDGYKIHNILYRYNVQEGSNISLSDLLIKSGYILHSTMPSEEETTSNNMEDGGE